MNIEPSGAKNQQAGFTIVELLIATAVFSMVLVIVTMGFMALSNSYFKGTVVAETQSATRNISDVITKNLQFSGLDVAHGTQSGVANLRYFCTNGQKFFYRYNVKYTGTTNNNTPGLFMQPYTDCGNDALNTNAGTQLLGQNMRVASLEISGNRSDGYTLKLRVAYGETDMFCSTSSGVACTGSDSIPDTEVVIDDLQCKTSGNYFCAVSGLNSNVQNRVTGN